MAIFKVSDNQIIPLKAKTFSEQGLQERQMQTMLKDAIEAIAPGTLVVSEEFSNWEDSKRRIDLLAIDRSANLVVIELKRTEDGGHMELQAIRYAAMVSTMRFDELVDAYGTYLSKNGVEKDAEGELLKFLGWPEPQEEKFAQEVKIVLVSADFSSEITTSVMWLNSLELDITCVKIRPYDNDGETLFDVQTIIPIPDAEEYIVKSKQKQQRAREARTSTMDYTQYDVSIGGKAEQGLGKGRMMLYLVTEIISSGVQPEVVAEAMPKMKKRLFESLDGELSSKEAYDTLMEQYPGGVLPRAKRYFTGEDDLLHINGKTYMVTNQWGRHNILDAVKGLQESFPELDIRVTPAES